MMASLHLTASSCRPRKAFLHGTCPLQLPHPSMVQGPPAATGVELDGSW
uniref:Uncharacterized protein n=1 Tax=Arundo donax TaxID=35708 RepID=A0A0A8Z9K5_ARUDO